MAILGGSQVDYGEGDKKFWLSGFRLMLDISEVIESVTKFLRANKISREEFNRDPDKYIQMAFDTLNFPRPSKKVKFK